MTPDEVLERLRRIPGEPLYVIGVKESGVTVASQQGRAIHLVDARVATGRITAGSRVY